MSKIFNLKVDNGGIGVITFDVAGDAMNTWTDAAFKDVDEIIGELAKTPDIKGIIFISGKPDNFLSGANLKMISDIEKAEDVRQMLDLFHGSFAKLNAFHYPPLYMIPTS